jgi:hypothetical protein
MAIPIRPGLPQPTAPQARPDVARAAAQKAFFQAALGQAEGPGMSARPAADPTAQRAQKIPTALPAEPPSKILRPGSLLDIKV